VALQGVGQVGFYLAKLLVEAGAEVSVADINPHNIERAVTALGVKNIALEEVLSAEVDVLAPCALGASINVNSIDKIKAAVVAGAANNQLASPDMGAALRDRNILYAPDYVINAGGIINVYYQTIADRNAEALGNHVGRIAGTLTAIFKRAEAEGLPTSVVADRMAEEIFKQPLSASKVA
jgi:leucine dehydrogenase